MQFSTIYSRVESLANVTGQRALIKDAIQMGLYRATAVDLPYLMTDGFITTIAPYTTGTASVTVGSTAVTGTTTVWTALMVGRKIRFGSDTAWYRIATRTSNTAITLESAYQGTTNTAATFEIYKDEYKLPADMDVYKVMRQIENGVALVDIENTAFDMALPIPTASGDPGYSIMVGTKLDTYTTGTVSITVNLSALTGSGTSWATVEGLGKGSKITIGTNVYTVKSVDSDTAITIYETAIVTVSAATYSMSLDNYIIQFEPYPDAARNIYFKYQRLPFLLIGDADVPDLPDQWHHILISAGLIWAWETKDKEESKIYEAIFGKQVQEMWRRVGHISVTRRYPRASQDDLAMARASRGPRYPAGYGIPMRYR